MHEQTMNRRAALGAAGALVASSAWTRGAMAQDAPSSARTLLGISCSERKGRTTASALTLCLDAAREADASVRTELIELAEMSIPAYLAAGLPLREGDLDDFPALAEKLSAPEVAGIIVGSPVYFGGMSALCKAFLERCLTLRKDGWRWSGKAVGALAVGGTRNGGQELTVQGIHTSLMGQDVIIVGTGRPSVRIGATLWNQNDSVEGDEFGVGTARDLGRHLAEVTGRLAAR